MQMEMLQLPVWFIIESYDSDFTSDGMAWEVYGSKW